MAEVVSQKCGLFSNIKSVFNFVWTFYQSLFQIYAQTKILLSLIEDKCRGSKSKT